jgi:VIT1/CCC1 family predicted Fe2+/Mn2+ transporter
MNENLVQLSVAIGVFFPILAALVKQQGWSQQVNAVVATVLAGIAGYVTVALSEPGVSWETWGTSSVAIFVAAVAAFAGFWKPTGIDDAIKNATSVKKA